MNNPVIEYYDNGNKSSERYYINNKLHRENKPAVIRYYNNGNKKYEEYYINNKLHRTNGPAYISFYNNGNVGSEEYSINDQVHRINGPAIIGCYPNGKIIYIHWWYNGDEYTNKVKEWLRDNKRNWKHMKEHDFNQMWMEIL